MTIGSNYPTPVTVNGFVCKNCTDVDYAKKHIDPAHPKSGPFGINAKDDPTVKNVSSSNVIFGGSLSSLSAIPTMTATNGAVVPSNGDGAASTATAATIGTHLDFLA